MEGYAQQFLLVTIVPAALPRDTHEVVVMPSACPSEYANAAQSLDDTTPQLCVYGVTHG